mmetsp:Transcript_12906/g.36777  ORF Transcript_12906/g.36777 Transcript_12906/m.36777 type:complete len:317 (-) Transcript_12906:958-1908(-)
MLSLHFRCDCTRAINSCLSKGLWIQSLQPSSKPLTTELAWFLAETMMMGSSSAEYVFRCSVRTSKPLIPGIMRSSRMRSGMTVLPFSMYSRHSVPLMQTIMEKPQGSSTERMTSWFTWSSSTDMMTLGNPSWGSGALGTLIRAASWPWPPPRPWPWPWPGAGVPGLAAALGLAGGSAGFAKLLGPSQEPGLGRGSLRGLAARALGAPVFAAAPGAAEPRSGGAPGPTAGRETASIEPLPCVLSMFTLPLWIRTTSRTMARPKPMPSYLRLSEVSSCWNGSKIRLKLTLLIPMPVSSMTMSTVFLDVLCSAAILTWP